jgi:hypothetical protein
MGDIMTMMVFITHPMEVFNIKLGFWDSDGFYFNRDGYDKHGGYYDDDYNYIHGPNWDEKNQCYKAETSNEFDYYEDDGDSN